MTSNQDKSSELPLLQVNSANNYDTVKLHDYLATIIYNTMLYTVFTWHWLNLNTFKLTIDIPYFILHPHMGVMECLLSIFGRTLILWPHFFISSICLICNRNSMLIKTNCLLKIDSCDMLLKCFPLLQALTLCFMAYWLVSGVWRIIWMLKLFECSNK